MILENPRFQLIPAAPELAEAVCGYYVRNREFLTPYDPRRDPVFFTPDYQRLLLAQDQAMSQAGAGHRFYIRLLESPDQVAGTVSLTSIVQRGPSAVWRTPGSGGSRRRRRRRPR